MSGNEYRGFFADFYDILHAGLPDVEHFIGIARELGPKILELGSGSGRVLLPLAAAGFHVTGVDSAPDMMAACRRKLSLLDGAVSQRVTLHEADVTTLRLDSKFDLVLAPCNFLNHFLAEEDALKVLETAKAHLAPGGVFVIDQSMPDIGHMVLTNGVKQEFWFTDPLSGAEIRDTFTSTFDFVTQTETDDITIEEYVEGNITRRAESHQVLTYYFPREIRLLARASGLGILREQGSLGKDVPIDADSGEMVFFMRQA